MWATSEPPPTGRSDPSAAVCHATCDDQAALARIRGHWPTSITRKITRCVARRAVPRLRRSTERCGRFGRGATSVRRRRRARSDGGSHRSAKVPRTRRGRDPLRTLRPRSRTRDGFGHTCDTDRATGTAGRRGEPVPHVAHAPVGALHAERRRSRSSLDTTRPPSNPAASNAAEELWNWSSLGKNPSDVGTVLPPAETIV